MTTKEHIPEGRLVKISNRMDDFRPEERTHIANCEHCGGLLAALFTLNSDDQNSSR
jgi:hypothetical protein